MSETSDVHELRNRVASLITDGDFTGAWAAITSLVNAVERSEVPEEKANERLAECLEWLCAWRKAVGDDAISPLTGAERSTIASAPTLAAAAAVFMQLAWQVVYPWLIADVMEQSRSRLESVAYHKLHDASDVRGVLQDAYVQLHGKLEAPCPVEDIVNAAYRCVRNLARTRGRSSVANARRFTPEEDVRHLLGYTPNMAVAATLEELDELAIRVLPLDLRSVYVLRRQGHDRSEIADRLRITSRTVGRRWKRSVEALKEALKHGGARQA